MLSDVREPALDAVAATLRADGSEGVLAVPADATRDEDVARACAMAADRFGRLDVVVHAVGIVEAPGDAVELPLATWERMLAVNLTSAFLLAKHAVPCLREAGGGAIVNVASVSGLANQEGAMAYSVTKAAMLSLTRSLAIDLARDGIRANAVCPGSVETPLVEDAARQQAALEGSTVAEVRRRWTSQYPSGRFSTPADVADAVLYLASPQAAGVSGAALVVDGGLTALLPER